MDTNLNHPECDSGRGGGSNLHGKEGCAEVADEALLEKALEEPAEPSGMEAASELFGRYQNRVYFWCYRYLRDHEEALDLAQEVLLAAYRALDAFKGKSRFSSWLFAITRNRCLNACRTVGLLRDEETEPNGLPDPEVGPDQRIEGEEEERELLELIKRELEPEQQEVLWLRCIERMPVDEITKMLGIRTASGARGILQSARRRLKTALEKRRSDERECGS